MQIGMAIGLGDEQHVVFRELVEDIPSTTYATFGVYKYPAKFIPHVIAYILRKYVEPGMTVFDPFAGYGTVGILSRLHGCNYELWDLNPILEVTHSVATMKQKAINIPGLIKEIQSSKRNFTPDWSNMSYWFDDEFVPLLNRVWGFYHAIEDRELKLILTIPLLKVTKYFSYGDEKVHKLYRSKRSKRKVEQLLATDWEQKFFSMLESEIDKVRKKIEEYNALEPKCVGSVVRAGVDTLNLNLNKQVDMLITSPPYLQAQEYIRTTKLELYWLGHDDKTIKELSSKELPYREVENYEVKSATYKQYREVVEKEPHLKKLYDRYFFSILGAFSRLQTKVTQRMFIFVGHAKIRTIPIPIDRIVIEHLTQLGWEHEITLIDKIVSHVMFESTNNPATGLIDERMKAEYMVVLRRK